MKILFVGEIVARPGRKVVSEVLPKILETEKPDLVIANAENLAHGRGATTGTIEEMQSLGIDFFTGGDHLFWHKGFEDEISSLPLLRPLNMSEETAGAGFQIVEKGSFRVLVINAMSQPFINETLKNPYLAVEEVVESHLEQKLDAIIVDFHAEFTSDKHTMGFFLDGKVTAVVGTHTHVPTADPRILPEGTMYVTDVGMCGNIDSVLGVKKEIIIDRAVYDQRQKFEWEIKGRRAFRSVLIDTEKPEIRRLDVSVT